MRMMKFYLLSCLLLVFPLALCDDRHVYIVYLGEHSGDKTHQEIEDTHHSYLFSVKSTKEESRASLLYSYKNSINGFAALLTADEAAVLSKMDDVVSAFRSHPHQYSVDTTRSWNFLGLHEGLGDGRKLGMGRRSGILHKAKYGKDVIVGLLDLGIWPESHSFHDEGLGPVPEKWKGICEVGDSFDSSHCNRKIIGARYYLKGYEASFGALNRSNDFRSPRDHDGHGSHTSSTVGGRSVKNVAAPGGFAHGTASGGAPLVRLAMYKVCWPVGNGTLAEGNTCDQSDMLAAIDDAIGDGVDVISISIGPRETIPFRDDGIAIGALHATKRNIVVSCSAGNQGPTPSTVRNSSPWIITVGASGTDREFSAPVELGNNITIKGQTLTTHKLKNHLYSLVYAGDVVEPHVPKNSTAGQCLPGSLSPKKMKGKIVLCFRGEGTRIGKGKEVKRAGGAGMVLGNSALLNNLVLDAHVLPATAVTADDATRIFNYIKSSKKPTAKLSPAGTAISSNPAPVMAEFSSRGPNSNYPNILKPDITAPGVNILAAWSEASTESNFGTKPLKYNFESGTSMACPHVAAIAALIKAVHPTWSSAAVRSAIITTATKKTNLGTPITTESGEVANAFSYGAGHLRPVHAYDPGLVYDASYTDYLRLLCDNGDGQVDPNFKCPKVPISSSDLNYPSLSISNITSSVTVTRTVTNVGGSGKTLYYSIVENPEGFVVKIHPRILYFSQVGEKKRFTITVKNEGKSKTGEYSFGSYSWLDGIHVARSPIVVSPA
ncbi:hypothetical protein GIB67_028752 [Kingdonia uniflora]|uniref:Subtilisin-like protease SBT5.6 n=1 Tax=Kingdonia uniflora TaxID=39325 RepID=A0A7J7NQU2_9MAGN|nr:hypothetical protein GIB67_028752 [Kingdonia uniflora]